ncbi:hypothetical protein EXIGLDRAFT_721931 [Exidia glandulosa HHB12029]|nr:hypothetical protein EXIGLDRAFT_721931 [Exidia glandulosa HHB12029]
MPPGRVWSMLTPEQRHEDYIGRLPSEAGYVAAIKRKRGQKLKDDKTWRLEEGLPEDQERLDEMEAAIREANDRKRHNAHHPLAEGYTSA